MKSSFTWNKRLDDLAGLPEPIPGHKIFPAFCSSSSSSPSSRSIPGAQPTMDIWDGKKYKEDLERNLPTQHTLLAKGTWGGPYHLFGGKMVTKVWGKGDMIEIPFSEGRFGSLRITVDALRSQIWRAIMKWEDLPSTQTPTFPHIPITNVGENAETMILTKKDWHWLLQHIGPKEYPWYMARWNTLARRSGDRAWERCELCDEVYMKNKARDEELVKICLVEEQGEILGFCEYGVELGKEYGCGEVEEVVVEEMDEAWIRGIWNV